MLMTEHYKKMLMIEHHHILFMFLEHGFINLNRKKLTQVKTTKEQSTKLKQ